MSAVTLRIHPKDLEICLFGENSHKKAQLCIVLSFILDSNGYRIKCKTPSLTRIVIGTYSLRTDYLCNSICATAGGTGATGIAATTSCVPVTFGAKLVCSGKVYQRCFIIFATYRMRYDHLPLVCASHS